MELRLIAGDIARAGRWLRRLPWRAANSVYRRVPSWCPACHECGVRRETKMPLRFWSRLRHQGIFPLCNECRARLVRQQAEEFNAHLAKLLEDYERMLVSRDQP